MLASPEKGMWVQLGVIHRSKHEMQTMSLTKLVYNGDGT